MTNTHITIGGHKVSAGKVYSTSEVRTGDVWIDGKPIYRKVVVSPTTTTQASTYRDLYLYEFAITDMADIVSFEGYYKAVRSGNTNTYRVGGATFSDNSARSPIISSSVRIASSGFEVAVSATNGYFTSVGNGTFTVEYTKTTD